jgi:hypothetical protein
MSKKRKAKYDEMEEMKHGMRKKSKDNMDYAMNIYIMGKKKQRTYRLTSACPKSMSDAMCKL